MLKIWLSWLQPSIGILGTALVLSNPLCTYAASKPLLVRNPTPKIPTQASQWSALKLNGTRIDGELSSKIALTPDLAVRQLAMNSMTTSGLSPITAKVKTPQIGRNAVASFVSPSMNLPKASAKASKQAKPQYVKNSVAAALAQAINPQAPVPVPGLYIGNSNPRGAIKVASTAKALPQPVAAATEIGAPTPLSAMMAAKTAIDPYPVVRPELMQKLDKNPVAVKTPPVVDLSPIANIPTVKSQSTAPKTILPQAKANPAAAPYKSLDPIANIPSGLQRLLGNNLNRQPMVASASAKAKLNKTNPLVALRQLVSPSTPAVPSVNAASLQLATAQAYTANVPKFSIPGETMLTAKQFQPMKNLVAKRVQKNFSTIIASSQRNYTTTLAPTKQPWMVVDRRNSLGGLILGSQPLTSVPQVASLLPTNANSLGLPARNLVNFN
ncbi:hypothetical protein [Chamaesiphon sp. GL140_3_metabinner_50]|uniref:hypothetical protein n=1 Tax=Chamaesiphon sp. GL140_3_metabinner_50 TaxID=2970812 RepID=UPI0025D10EA0|nr:hypothetical protein [Chamaesiphon sp. GL140_3_metabinner_50]